MLGKDVACDCLGRGYLGGGAYPPGVSSAGGFGSGYGPAVNNSVLAIAVQPDDKLIVAGFFTSPAGSAASRLGRLNTDGTGDAAYTGKPGGTPPPKDRPVLPGGPVMTAHCRFVHWAGPISTEWPL